MKWWHRAGAISLCVTLAAAAFWPGDLKGSPPAGKPAAQAATAAARPSVENLLKSMAALDQKVTSVMPTPALLADADFRAGDGRKIVPQLKETVTLMADLEQALRADPKFKDEADLIDEIHVGRFHAMAYLAILGDKPTADALESQAKWDPSADGIAANCAWTLSQWLLASKDAAAQQKILDTFADVAKENAENDEVLSTLAVMTNLGPANDEMGKKVVAVLRANMKGPAAKSLLTQIDGAQEQKAMVGKPLTVEGRTSTDGKFDSALYKGQVVLLDFWATWCGPCIAELPNVKKAYAAYHDKGFEIVGLSCDAGDDVLNAFTKDKEMPWVQLRETSQTAKDNWHPLAKKFHVDGIPQMFLIDRDGILRYVDAREDLDKKVAKLLAETKAPSTGPAESQPAGK